MPEESTATAPTAEYHIDDLIAWPRDSLSTLNPQRLKETSPVDVADFLERLEVDEARQVLRLLGIEEASEVLAEMDAEDSADVFEAMREERAVDIIEELDPDDAADVVGELNEEDRARILDALEPETAATVKSLLEHDPETAGGVMNPDVCTVYANMTIDEAIRHVRSQPDKTADLSYIYVVDRHGRLQGLVKMRALLTAMLGQTIEGIMEDKVLGISTPDRDREAVALDIAEHNINSLPVVDENGMLLGIVTVDDVIDIIQEEATEDLQKLHGAGGDESIRDPLTFSLKRRNPWLQVNLITAFLAAAIIYYFEENIQALPILAAFMPIIASLGGNAGHQTLAVAIRSLALDDIQTSEGRKICIKELLLGFVNGVIIGIVAGIVAYVLVSLTSDYADTFKLSIVIFAAMVLNMALAGLAGAFIPLLLKKLNFDPAQSSSIFLTGVTDVAGFFIFLSLGSALLL